MGILTDAFIATETELATIQFERPVNPFGFFPTLQGKNVDPFMLTVLESIVTEQEDIYVLADRIGEPIRGDESSEQWIYPFSETLAARLADLTTDEIARYATRWADCQEWSGSKAKRLRPSTDAMRRANAIEYLRNLCQLAIQAQGQGKHMYMWISL